MTRLITLVGVQLLGSVLILGGNALPTFAQDRAGKPNFVPFRHGMGIVPGHTKLSETKLLLGEPDRVQYQRPKKIREVYFPGGKDLHYVRQGITLHIPWEKRNDEDPAIEAITFSREFRGGAAAGLVLGMSKNQALNICKRDYYIDPLLSFNNTYMIAEKKGDPAALTLWFEADKLVEFRMDPCNYVPPKRSVNKPANKVNEADTFDASDPRAKPFVTLLFATQTQDVKSFQSAYSSRIHKQIQSEKEWEFGLRAVGSQLKEKLGDLTLTDLHFTFEGDRQQGRLLLVGAKGVPAKGMKVVAEEGQWKFDEK